MAIKLTDVAIHFKNLEHQITALEYLEANTKPEVLESFEKQWRTPLQKQETNNNTWGSILLLAKEAGAKFPEVVASQWALESGWGKHTSGKNNYFGLKGGGSSVNTQEFINGQWVTIQAGFIDFPDIKTCVYYLVDRWYKDFGKFKGVNRAANRNECAQLLVKEGYATDPGYATKLIQIMDKELQVSGGTQEDVISQKLLNVPYQYQLDNESGKGYRECFSSTCAMIAMYYGKVLSDDEYNQIRSRYGDTTDKNAQLGTLKHLGLSAKFITNGNAALLENELRNGRPVAVGWLHQGSVSYPTGGGHWTCCVGFEPDSFIFNDPNGEADMVNGGYVSHLPSKGKGVKYSRKNWLRRWECDGNNTGWAILVTK